MTIEEIPYVVKKIQSKYLTAQVEFIFEPFREIEDFAIYVEAYGRDELKESEYEKTIKTCKLSVKNWSVDETFENVNNMLQSEI